MSTITDPKLIKTLLENKGVYPGDPPAVIIYKYTSYASKEKSYAVFHRHEHDDMSESPFILDYQILMAKGVLTNIGRKELIEINIRLLTPAQKGTLMHIEAEIYGEKDEEQAEILTAELHKMEKELGVFDELVDHPRWFTVPKFPRTGESMPGEHDVVIDAIRKESLHEED